MGPGYFPVSLGVILVLVGAVLLISAKVAAREPPEERLPPEWRGWAAIVLGTIAFGVLGKHAGLVPASLALVFISALGDRQNSVWNALALSVAMVIFCVIVFSWGLNIQFPLFGAH